LNSLNNEHPGFISPYFNTDHLFIEGRKTLMYFFSFLLRFVLFLFSSLNWTTRPGRSLIGQVCLFSLFCVFAFSHAADAQGRSKIPLNEDWDFAKDEDYRKGTWERVTIPHTWNVADVMDDEPGYYRGVGWYRKSIYVNRKSQSGKSWLYFEGANQFTEVYINGAKAGSHTGGYSGFAIDASPYLKYGASNEIVVRVDNSHNPDIAPLSADFTFYGGIYRDVYLVQAGPVHFDFENHGSNGVFINTPYVSDASALVSLHTVLKNESETSRTILLRTRIIEPGGKTIITKEKRLTIAANSQLSTGELFDSIKGPRLWSPDLPQRYLLHLAIYDNQGRLLDDIRQSFGLRYFHFDADKGFFLNGKSLKLMGASRHQDFEGLGNAVPDKKAIADLQLLKKMGANFLRVAHYPQDPSVLEACDSLGLLASVEIPVVNEITGSQAFTRNCMQMQTEMIRQFYNHPSVIIWCYMNEVLLRTRFEPGSEERKNYLASVRTLALALDSLTRVEDPSRYTMMANHGNLEQYEKAELIGIPSLLGWNLYAGWYGGNMEEFESFLDDFHQRYPKIPIVISEYGADADPRIVSTQPARFDKSAEYATRFHQHYFSEIMKRPFVAGGMIWNLADFNSETRKESMPHINNKGLLDWSRRPKDAYQLYTALLNPTPFIKILGPSGSFPIDSSSYLLQIASNSNTVSVSVNSKIAETWPVVDGIAQGRIQLGEGRNTVIAASASQQTRDTMELDCRLIPRNFFADRFMPMNISLGGRRRFHDSAGNWWIESGEYVKGSWGSIGGTPFMIAKNGRLPYGTDRSIRKTENDPVYQTQLTGIRGYRFDVMPGHYQLTLHFAELVGGTITVPPYNLEDSSRYEPGAARIFRVDLNGTTILPKLDLAGQYGVGTAVVKSFDVEVKDGEAIELRFDALSGEAVLNAIQLRKIDDERDK